MKKHVTFVVHRDIPVSAVLPHIAHGAGVSQFDLGNPRRMATLPDDSTLYAIEFDAPEEVRPYRADA